MLDAVIRYFSFRVCTGRLTFSPIPALAVRVIKDKEASLQSSLSLTVHIARLYPRRDQPTTTALAPPNTLLCVEVSREGGNQAKCIRGWGSPISRSFMK